LAKQDWKKLLKTDPTDWLLEDDKNQPAVRYYTLRDILGRVGNDKEVKAAKASIMTSGPVPVILAAQHPEGYWGERPRYTGTMPALVFLGQLGADGADPRIRAGCEFLLSRFIAGNGAPLGDLSLRGALSGFNYCAAAMMGSALIDLGRLEDQRLQAAIEWLAEAINGKRAAAFVCSARNANLPCAWGAIKAMVALSKVPAGQRTGNMREAIQRGVDFLLSRDPVAADYPFGRGNQPSSIWFKFYYPLGSEADVLQNLEVLAELGQANNPKLANALDLVVSKQNQQGRWLLERAYKELPETQERKVFYWYHNSLKLYITGKELAEIQERKGQPSKWVTLRVLRVLKQYENNQTTSM
jgi:hypothetical protein